MKLFLGFFAIARGFSVPDGEQRASTEEDIMTAVLADCSANNWDTDRCATEMTEILYVETYCTVAIDCYGIMEVDRPITTVCGIAVKHLCCTFARPSVC